MVCVRFTKKWPITKIQVRDILKILKSVCVGPSPKKVGGSSNAIKRVGPLGPNLVSGCILGALELKVCLQVITSQLVLLNIDLYVSAYLVSCINL